MRSVQSIYPKINVRFLAAFLTLFTFLSSFTSLSAQTPYFQQEANYTIAVNLDDIAHSLDGQISIEYTNNSPDALTEIWMHLWPNAFKNNHTAFCKQKLAGGNSNYFFSEEKKRGHIEKIDFQVNGAKAVWKYDKNNPDIAVISLAQPLAAGAKCTISTPFFVKIPDSFSRLGHVGQSYQITQWYPKPAVYDHKGWHAMPYLDMGEFFSEFGSFDVTLTLPSNYVVGATGMLQTETEWTFLKEKIAESNEKLIGSIDEADTAFPTSASTTKTIRYTAEKVHDFAWFADKRFYVQRDTAVLASGKMVDCWAMFTNFEGRIWKKGAFYTKRAVEFFSENVGEYPWPQATAVQSALSAGGGMEYPMITVIGPSRSAKSLDEVITHEVGHNWFYGILASNERDHPFMDEGLNTYYENRYMRKYYGGNNYAISDKGWQRIIKYPTIEQLAWTAMNSIGYNRPPDSHSDDFTEIGYGLQVYAKTGILLHWLEQSAGTERMDIAMKDYFNAWKFKHPYPEDFRVVLEKNGLKVDWLFEQLQDVKTTDYGIHSAKRNVAGYELTVHNHGTSNAPIEIAAFRDDSLVFAKWYADLSDGKIVIPIAEKVDYFELDPSGRTLDANRANNRSGMRPFDVGMLKPIDDPKAISMGILPWLGWNNYDKTMLGAAIYSPILPVKKVQYFLLPGFATGSKSLVGLADVRFRVFPKYNILKRFTLGLTAKSFNYDYKQDNYLRFYRAMPFVRMDFRTSSKTFRHWAQYRSLFIGTEGLDFNNLGTLIGKTWDNNLIHELRYEAQNRMLPNPWTLAVALEGQQYTISDTRTANYVKSSLKLNKSWFYASKRKVSARVFAGFFLKNSQRNSGNVASPLARGSFALTPQGYSDYKFDEVYLGRTEADGFLSRQVGASDGGFKNAFGSSFAGQLGNSNNYILALNLRADLPKRLPLGIPLEPYFDIGYYDNATPTGESLTTKDQVLWSGGLALSAFRGGLEVYFPLVNSKNMKNLYCERSGGSNTSALFCGGNYWKWISWRIHIPRRDVVEVMEYNLR